jgi:hypothetical protein
MCLRYWPSSALRLRLSEIRHLRKVIWLFIYFLSSSCQPTTFFFMLVNIRLKVLNGWMMSIPLLSFTSLNFCFNYSLRKFFCLFNNRLNVVVDWPYKRVLFRIVGWKFDGYWNFWNHRTLRSCSIWESLHRNFNLDYWLFSFDQVRFSRLLLDLIIDVDNF